MPLIPCPEGCPQNVSTTALRCPACGYDIQRFLATDLTKRAAGIPIGPLDYWSSHFWYYSGCKSVSIDVAPAGCIKFHEPIMTLRYHNNDGSSKTCIIRSPTDGLVVRDKIRLRTMPNIGYLLTVPPVNQEFIVIRPHRHHVSEDGRAFESVQWCNNLRFDSLTEAIYEAVAGDSFMQALLNLVFSDRGLRKLDPKRFFNTKEDLLKAADALRQVSAVWLPDWDFSKDTYEFGD